MIRNGSWENLSNFGAVPFSYIYPGAVSDSSNAMETVRPMVCLIFYIYEFSVTISQNQWESYTKILSIKSFTY